MGRERTLASASHSHVRLFSGRDEELLRECQRLRYAVYHHDLGLDMPDLDHAAQLDQEARDPTCDFAGVWNAEGEMTGCIRMQPPERRPFYAELEFDLLGASWTEGRYVEGARFAVRAAERNGPVPLLLFQAFRRYCRAQRADRVLSVIIIRAAREDRRLLARLVRFLRGRTQLALDRGRPAPDYRLVPPSPIELADAAAPNPGEVSPMLLLLANRRTTLCSQPAYCSKFGTFNFLLTSGIR